MKYLFFVLFVSAAHASDCKLYYTSRAQVENLKRHNAEIKELSASVNTVLRKSFDVLNTIDKATLGLASAIVTNGKASFEQIKPVDWEKLNLVGTVIYQDSPFSGVPLKGAKLTISEREVSRTITTGTRGEFAEYFYKIVPYARLRLFPSPIIEFGSESKKSINVPITIKLESKTCTAEVKITEIPLDSFVLVATKTSEVAITIDDFSIHDGAKLNIEERDEKILAALEKNKVRAGLFVRCASLESPRVAKRLEFWDKAGHMIANHTYSHWNYNKKTFAEFSEDIKKCDNQLKGKKNFARLFRFPMLKGGNTNEKNTQIQNFLKEQGYKNGYVTIDASDWFISDKLEAKLKEDPRADLGPYRDYYLSHMWERAQFYDELARKYWKKPVRHTLLIHHNLLNSLFLGDLIEMFKKNGWGLVDAQLAFKDPLFDQVPEVIPAGESILWSLAKVAGDKTLRMPGEDSAYEEKSMLARGL